MTASAEARDTALLAAQAAADKLATDVSIVDVSDRLAISSTDCRDRVGRGMPVWYLVPDGVVQYIEKRGLYRESPRRGGQDAARAAALPHDTDYPQDGHAAARTDPHAQEVPR